MQRDVSVGTEERGMERVMEDEDEDEDDVDDGADGEDDAGEVGADGLDNDEFLETGEMDEVGVRGDCVSACNGFLG